MPRVSDAHKQAVRQNILDAASRIIERGDLSKLTTRAVIEEAGVSNGTLYHYFTSIEHLYAELAEARLHDVLDEIAHPGPDTGARTAIPAVAAPSDAVDRLMAWLRADLFGDRKLTAAVAGFRSRIEHGDAQRDAVEGLNRYAVREFGDLLRQLQSEGGLRADLDADALVEMIDLLWDGVGRRQNTRSFQTSYDRIVAVVVDVLLHGVRIDSSATGRDMKIIDPAEGPR